MAAIFVSPDESAPLIDRGSLPLSVPAIEQLATDYATLADESFSENPAQLRRQAQLIVLAERLSPSQALAREIRLGLIAGTYQAVSTPEQRKAAQKRVFAKTRWLLEEPAQSEGHLLGQLTLDIIAGIKPTHALLKTHHAAGTKRRWAGVIAPLSDFGGEDGEGITAAPIPEPRKPAPAPSPAPEVKPAFLISQLQTESPMIVENRGGLKNPTLVPLTLNLRVRKNSNLELNFTPRLVDRNFQLSSTTLRNLNTLFSTRDRQIPDGAQLNFETGSLSYSTLNKDNLLAPLAMMLDSALSGKKLSPNTILFAKLNTNGTLARPTRSWELIQALRKRRPAPGTRLLVPPSLAEEMSALLVLKDPGFLFRFEVIACETLDQAAEFYLETNQPPTSLASASANFREVSTKARSRMRELPQFLVFDGVKKRLEAAARADRRHLSASVLLKQASARRPKEYTRRIFAMEYRLALAPLKNFPTLNGLTNSGETLKAFHLARRKEWREFADSRLIARAEEPLIKEGQKVIDALSPISRKLNNIESVLSARAEYEQWKIQVTLFFETLDQIATE